MSDIRKWFMKQHDKGNGSAAKTKPDASAVKPPPTAPSKPSKPEADEDVGQKRRKTSKYFAGTASEIKGQPKEESKTERTPSKRKHDTSGEKLDVSGKHPNKRKLSIDDDDNDDFEMASRRKNDKVVEPARKSKKVSGSANIDEDEEDEGRDKEAGSAVNSDGRGRGGKGAGTTAGRGAGAAAGRGRGRGLGRGGFMNFGERNPPPHKGEKEIPEGAPDCLAGLTFVISGTLDSLEREEAEDLIKRHGGRVTGSVSKKTDYLLADEDVGGRKSTKAKELGTKLLTEDGLFDMIHKSKPVKSSPPKETKREKLESLDQQQKKSSPVKSDGKGSHVINSTLKVSPKNLQKGVSRCNLNGRILDVTWTEKYKPKVTANIVGNQGLVKQLHDWLACWNQQFLHSREKGRGKKPSDSGSKKAVLLSGPPGIGKTTSAKLVSQMLGFQSIEVNASDNRGKADSKVFKGIGGSTSNSVKELVSNESLNLGKDWSKHPKTVLIMDEVDGMSAGDRGGVADLIASIKISKLPIICICNDRYSQKLKSLVNYCLLLNYRKPTKQQMAKRLSQIAGAEGLEVNEIALEELADRVSGDMRMAINQLQYMSLSKSVIKYDDIRRRLLNSSKDEDISPFTAVDRLFGYDGGKLRIDERIDLCMSDPDLVPLIIQETRILGAEPTGILMDPDAYICEDCYEKTDLKSFRCLVENMLENHLNYRPLSCGKDDGGARRMKLIARAAESIGNGDIINVQIRRYRQWQLSQSCSLAASIIPASLMHGSREVLEQGERNFNRFGGWLGKNSTMGKNSRLLQDTLDHILASQESNLDRDTLRLDYLPVMLKQLTNPLQLLSKDAAVQQVVEFMDTYSLSQEDYDTIVELSKFQGHPNPLDGIPAAVKAALTKAYKQGSSNRIIRSADLITLPGLKKAPKKRIAAILEPVDDGPQEADAVAIEGEDDGTSEPEDEDEIPGESKVKLDLQSSKAKGIQVQLDLRNGESSGGKKTQAGKSKGSESAVKRKGSGGPKRKK